MYRFECNGIALICFNRIILVALLNIDNKQGDQLEDHENNLRNDGGQPVVVAVERIRSD